MPKPIKGLMDFTSQESVAPYVKAVTATTNTQDPSRAIHMKGSSANVNLDVGGETIQFYLLRIAVYLNGYNWLLSNIIITNSI